MKPPVIMHLSPSDAWEIWLLLLLMMLLLLMLLMLLVFFVCGGFVLQLHMVLSSVVFDVVLLFSVVFLLLMVSVTY